MQETGNKTPDSLGSVSFADLTGSFFKGLTEAIGNFLLYCKRHVILLCIFVGLGIVLGVLNYVISPVYYRQTMMVRHTELTLKTYDQMIRDLNNLASTGSANELKDRLHLSLDDARKIRTIQAYDLSGADLRKDTISLPERSFLIELTLTDDNKNVAIYQHAIINYFNNNEYFTKLKHDKIQLYEDRLLFLESELQKLDSLKEAYNKFLGTSKNGSVFYNNAFNPVELYKQSYEYSAAKEATQTWLLQNKNTILTIDDFKPTKAPDSVTVMKSVIIYAIIFFFIGCFLGAAFDLLKKTETA